MRRFAVLLGTWRIRGRTLGSQRDNIRGKVVVEWLHAGMLLQLRSELRVGGYSATSLEIVGYDRSDDSFAGFVYGTVTEVPLNYSWRIRGRSVEHAGLGATFRGRLDPRGRTLIGRWRADSGVTPAPQNTYDVVMTRID